MSQSTLPSRLAERIVTSVVRDEAQRDSIIGDLREEYVRMARRAGPQRAARWHAQQAVGIAFRYSLSRLLRRKPPVRWITLADAEPDGPWWSGLTRDVRHAWRATTQRPMLSASVIVTLALALATNSTTFSLLDALVLRPYRFAGVDRLIVATTVGAEDTFLDRINVTAADFQEWRDQAKTVKAWAMYQWWDANLSGVDIPEQVPGFFVSPGYFNLLSSPPVLGREFLDSESQPGQHRRAVIGHGLWARRFASDPNIIGKSIRLDGTPYEVVGVAAPGFNVPDGAEVWAPLAMTEQQWSNRRLENYGIVGRLADGVGIEQARAELTTIVDTQRRDHPDTNHRRYARIVSFTTGMSDPGAGLFIGVWQAAALLLLLIACANIANLLMARGAERASEYSIRLAMGAARPRLFAQTLIEGLILALGAVMLSLPLIGAGLAISKASIPSSVLRFLPGWSFIELDVELFLATALLGTIATLVFSLLPAIQATKVQVADMLRQSGRALTAGRSRQWARSALATTQMALALALVFASTLAITAANKTVNGSLGFDKDNVLVAQLNLPERNYADPDTRRRFIADVTESMQAIPAASEIGVVNIIPAAFNNWSRRFFPEGQNITEQEARTAQYRMATAEYFAAMKIPLRRGRLFDGSDRTDSTPVAIVSTTLARRYWGDDDPLGKRFKLAIDGPWITVVGVAGDVVHNWFDRRLDMFYVPISQSTPYSVAFAVRTVGDPHALAGDLRRAVARADADQPIAALQALDTMIEDRAAGFVFIARALGIVGVIALVLAIVGIYSLMAFLTAQRTQEIGVRMALGAGRWQVIRVTTGRALAITLAGTIIGSALAFGAGRLLESLLFGLVTTNAAQLAVLVVILGSVAMLAAYLPARRAAHLDPMHALRDT
ncbi:MAG TPA: ABC transporter permease [Vicinamibacterales bacterium]|nr:ABC transporter permease [Vicinamibacterales bacterium]